MGDIIDRLRYRFDLWHSELSKGDKIALAICFVFIALASAFWLLLSFRWPAALLFFGFVTSVAVQRFRSRPYIAVALWLSFFGWTWLPFDITFRVASDGPKWVTCCPGMPLDWKGALEGDRRGDCKFCSDVVSGFEPRYYLVW